MTQQVYCGKKSMYSQKELWQKYLPRRNKNICPKTAYVRPLKAALFSSQKLETT